MVGITYGLVDFVTGGPILDLPVKKGAKWNAQLNRPDALSCTVDMRDPYALSLDLFSSSEPMKTLLIARTDDDIIVAWGLIPDGGRSWSEDDYELDLVAQGVESSYFGEAVIAPPTVLTAALTVKDTEGFDIVNPALDTTVSGVSHGTIGKRLVQQRMAFPGAPTIFEYPADEAGFRTQSYALSDMKKIGPALSDLTKQEGGPDFAFDAQRAPDGLGLRIIMRHGSEARPRIGTKAGVWNVGGPSSPITGLKLDDAVAAGASLGLMTAGRTTGSALVSRVRNESLIASGYPPFDVVDTSRSDVKLQETLDRYNGENMLEASKTLRDLSFSVRGDASPGLGQFRPGDTIDLDFPSNHPWQRDPMTIRITSVSSDETGKSLKVGCVVIQ